MPAKSDLPGWHLGLHGIPPRYTVQPRSAAGVPMPDLRTIYTTPSKTPAEFPQVSRPLPIAPLWFQWRISLETHPETARRWRDCRYTFRAGSGGLEHQCSACPHESLEKTAMDSWIAPEAQRGC